MKAGFWFAVFCLPGFVVGFATCMILWGNFPDFMINLL